MFDSFVSWISSLLTGILSIVTNAMLSCLGIDISVFLEYFPAAATLYTILQSVAVGFVFAFAAWMLFKFFTGTVANLTDSPIQVLIMSAVATFLIYFGNYILQAVINVFSYPYAELLGTNTVGVQGFTFSAFGLALDAAIWATEGVAAGVAAIVYIIVMCLLGYQVLALIFEMIERWIMLGVLVYTAPLAWATVVSSTSRTIFSKWLNMFISQCLLMLVNAWSVKMLFSVLSGPNAFVATTPIAMRIILALCFCKVARQLDTYLKQIGLNPAGTGRSLLDDIRSVAQAAFRARMLAGAARGGSGARSTVLGSRTQQNSAFAAAQRVAAHNQKGYAGRFVDNILHPFENMQDKSTVRKAGREGELFAASDGSAAGGFAGAKAAAAYNNGQPLPDGMHVMDPGAKEHIQNPELSKAKLGEMETMGVSTEGTGSDTRLTGTMQDQAHVIGTLGNDAAVNGDINTAMTSAAESLSGSELETAVNDARNLNNQDISGALMENITTRDGLEDQLTESNFRAAQDAANMLPPDSQDAFRMEQFGTANPDLTLDGARQQYQQLSNQFGSDADASSYDLLFTDRPDPEALTMADLNDEGRSKMLSSVRAEHGQLLADAASHRAQAATAITEGEKLSAMGADATNLIARAKSHQKAAADLEHIAAEQSTQHFLGGAMDRAVTDLGHANLHAVNAEQLRQYASQHQAQGEDATKYLSQAHSEDQQSTALERQAIVGLATHYENPEVSEEAGKQYRVLMQQAKELRAEASPEAITQAKRLEQQAAETMAGSFGTPVTQTQAAQRYASMLEKSDQAFAHAEASNQRVQQMQEHNIRASELRDQADQLRYQGADAESRLMQAISSHTQSGLPEAAAHQFSSAMDRAVELRATGDPNHLLQAQTIEAQAVSDVLSVAGSAIPQQEAQHISDLAGRTNGLRAESIRTDREADALSSSDQEIQSVMDSGDSFRREGEQYEKEASRFAASFYGSAEMPEDVSETYSGMRQDSIRARTEAIRLEEAADEPNLPEHDAVSLRMAASQKRQEAEHLEQEASAYATDYYANTIPGGSTHFSPTAPVYEGVEWNDLTDTPKEAALQDVCRHYDSLVAEGHYTDAAEYSLSRTGSLNPHTVSPSEIEDGGISRGHEAIENMAVSQRNSTITWTNVSANQGDLTGTANYRQFSKETGRFEDVYRNVSYKTEKHLEQHPLERTEEDKTYKATRIGNTTYYTNAQEIQTGFIKKPQAPRPERISQYPAFIASGSKAVIEQSAAGQVEQKVKGPIREAKEYQAKKKKQQEK